MSKPQPHSGHHPREHLPQHLRVSDPHLLLLERQGLPKGGLRLPPEPPRPRPQGLVLRGPRASCCRWACSTMSASPDAPGRMGRAADRSRRTRNRLQTPGTHLPHHRIPRRTQRPGKESLACCPACHSVPPGPQGPSAPARGCHRPEREHWPHRGEGECC